MNRLLAAMIPGLRRSIERDMQAWADIAIFRRRIADKEAREAVDRAAIALRLREGADSLRGVRGLGGRDYSPAIKEMAQARTEHLLRAYAPKPAPTPSRVRSSPRPVVPAPRVREVIRERDADTVDDTGRDIADAVAIGVAISSLFNDDDRKGCAAPPPMESGGGGDFGGGGATGSWDDSSSSSTDSSSSSND